MASACNRGPNSTTSIVKSTTINFVSEAHGCSNFFIYAISTDKTKVLIVQSEKDKLKLNSNPKDFEVGTQNLQVYIDDYKTVENLNKGPNTWYCDDTAKTDGIVPNKILAKSGKVRISYPSADKLNIELKNIKLMSLSGEELMLTNISFHNVVVGFYPG